MAVIGTYEQQPIDRLDYDVDASDLIGDVDSVSAVDVSVTPAGLTVNGIVTPAGTGAKLWVGPGTVGKYKIEVTVTTELGRVKQAELVMKIKED